MMPKISNGSTFGGIVNYANDIKDKGTTILASRGVDLRSNYTIAKSFKIQAMMNPRVKGCQSETYYNICSKSRPGIESRPSFYSDITQQTEVSEVSLTTVRYHA